ncbi:hypothetical protein [Pseudomonas sp. RIT411]|uniref:hypothetical protein n=1 Tax=Pseudomonas sp. RIT411 TaxID=2202160 RepID=UPI000D34592F|nr:hypothetical protein [Pseudomonas sp. RIT 411]RAU39285.1 hypothetical protein DBY63_012465 [Pseudomonas sp. RIT 411]
MRLYRCTIGTLTLALALTAGCVSKPAPQPRIAFPVAEYNALPKEGTGVVEGQAFMKTVGGDVKFGAGSEVTLNPITSYSEQWYRHYYELRSPLQAADTRQDSYILTTQADGSGNFKFTDVPPGRYFVTSTVRWQAPSQFGLTNQGGWLTNRITVSNGKTTRVMLTR